MPTPADIENWIAAGLPAAEVSVDGDGRHFDALIVADAFTGKTLIQRHQLVYRALGDKMQNQIHALSMKTLTPGERAATQ